MDYNTVTFLILCTLDPLFSCFGAVLFVLLALWKQNGNIWHNITNFQGAWRRNNNKVVVYTISVAVFDLFLLALWHRQLAA